MRQRLHGRAAFLLFRRILALFQILIILAGPVAPAAGSIIGTSAVCLGDHRLCHCSPGLIASGACCCAVTARMQQNGHCSHNPSADHCDRTRSENTESAPCIRELPCGPDAATLADGMMKDTVIPLFVLPQPRMAETAREATANLSPLVRHLAPPVPPPEA